MLDEILAAAHKTFPYLDKHTNRYAEACWNFSNLKDQLLGICLLIAIFRVETDDCVIYKRDSSVK